MRLNADFSQPVAVFDRDNDWITSPMPGVERKMLDRIGDEVARATSVVRYAAGSAFSPHVHDGGEEFLVLDGVFQDEHGDYPAGTYVRNPPTSRHTPSSAEGCTILVKLHQFDLADRTQVRIDTRKSWFVDDAARPGAAVLPLFRDDRERVRLERWTPGADVTVATGKGLEVFVLSGGFRDGGGRAFGRWDWLRLPPGERLTATAGDVGAEVWIKSDHLAGV